MPIGLHGTQTQTGPPLPLRPSYSALNCLSSSISSFTFGRRQRMSETDRVGGQQCRGGSVSENKNHVQLKSLSFHVN